MAAAEPDGLEGYGPTGLASSVWPQGGVVRAGFGASGVGRHRVLVVVGGAALGDAVVVSGECDLALASGVTAMTSPAIFVRFQPARVGRRRAVKAYGAADGTGWGEGAGVLVLGGCPTRAPVGACGAGRRAAAPSIRMAPQRVDRPERARSAAGDPRGAGQCQFDRRRRGRGVEGHGLATTLGDPI